MSARKKLLVSFYIAQYHMIYNQAEHNRNNNPSEFHRAHSKFSDTAETRKEQNYLHTKFNCGKRREGNLRFLSSLPALGIAPS